MKTAVQLLLIGALAHGALACDGSATPADGADGDSSAARDATGDLGDPDAGSPDVGSPDAGSADARPRDSGSADAGADAATDAGGGRDARADAADDDDARRPPTPQRIMCIGDSITEARFQNYAYRYHLWRLLVADGATHVDFVGSKSGTFSGGAAAGGWDSEHDGHWGAKADEILGGGIPYGGVGSIRAWAPVHRPTIALIQLGTNDCRGGQSGASTLGEIASIIAVLRESVPEVVVLVAQVIQSRQGPLNACLSSMNDAMPTWAAGISTVRSPVVVVDQWSALDPRTDLEDDYHTNESGGSKMAARWYRTLRDYI